MSKGTLLCTCAQDPINLKRNGRGTGCEKALYTTIDAHLHSHGHLFILWQHYLHRVFSFTHLICFLLSSTSGPKIKRGTNREL